MIAMKRFLAALLAAYISVAPAFAGDGVYIYDPTTRSAIGTAANPLIVGTSDGAGGVADPTSAGLVKQDDISATGTITTQNLSPTGAATAGSAVEITTFGKGSVAIDVAGTYTGVLSIQGTIDGVNWRTIQAGQAVVSDISNSTTALSATIASAATGIWRVNSAGYTKMRVSGLAAMTGTATIVLRASPGISVVEAAGLMPVIGPQAHGATVNSNPVRGGCRALNADYTAVSTGQVADCKSTLVGAIIYKPFAIPEQDWNYAAASSGIANTTTAVTVKAAAAAGIRNYITSITLGSEALTNATEFAVRDGAAGTVLWRIKIPTGGLPTTQFVFPSPIRGTAATLLEVVTLTASGAGAVYFNCEGYTAP